MDQFINYLSNQNLSQLQETVNTVNNDNHNESYSDSSDSPSTETLSDDEICDVFSPPYGCKHYLRRCKIVSPCCNNIYYCRLCHDDIHEFDHKINRFAIKTVICTECNFKQNVSQYCSNCKICFGIYFCEICNLWSDIDLLQYHCDKCNMCRIGRGQSYHCDKCNMCVKLTNKDDHVCSDVTDSLCPICMDDIFTSVKNILTMKCGHYIHYQCYVDLVKNDFKCPICCKTIVDVEHLNSVMNLHIENSNMPEEFKDKNVDIFCNDCHEKSNVKFHFIGHRCLKCNSYNTKRS